jgi:hypothetical protein
MKSRRSFYLIRIRREIRFDLPDDRLWRTCDHAIVRKSIGFDRRPAEVGERPGNQGLRAHLRRARRLHRNAAPASRSLRRYCDDAGHSPAPVRRGHGGVEFPDGARAWPRPAPVRPSTRRGVGTGTKPVHRITQNDLAAMAGVARESVSRTFREWQRQKVVEGSPRSGYVVHKAKLEGAAAE